MNINSLVYLYDQKDEYFEKLKDFCTKVDICFLESTSMEILLYLAKNIKPKYIVLNSKLMPSSLIYDFCQNNKECIVYTMGQIDFSGQTQNLYLVETFNDLQTLLESHIYYYNTTHLTDQKNEKIYYELVHNELDKLSFRQKLVGAKYLSELIYEILISQMVFNGKCSDMYPKIALKYNTSPASIERAMRFSIQQAYKLSSNKNLFYEISKCNKAPTVKELANYILDKVILQINKRQAS